MRKILIAVMAMVTILWFTTPTHATLWDRGGGLIYDDYLKITWLQDANYAKTSLYNANGLMTWDQATNWATNLVYGGYSDWRLPTKIGLYAGYYNEGEMGQLYYTELGNPVGGPLNNTGPFVNLQPSSYWSGTEYSGHPSLAWYFDFGLGFQNIGYEGNGCYAWAVRPGDVAAPVAPVPEPATMLLLGSGLLGLVGLRRRFKK